MLEAICLRAMQFAWREPERGEPTISTGANAIASVVCRSFRFSSSPIRAGAHFSQLQPGCFSGPPHRRLEGTFVEIQYRLTPIDRDFFKAARYLVSSMVGRYLVSGVLLNLR